MDSTTPIVFLHAFPLNSSMWDAQIAALGSRKTLAPDFPGFGERPVADASLEEFARAVLGDMDAAGIDKAVVVGLSMGGYVAFRLHSLAPERIAGLVLADTRAVADDDAGKAKRTDQAARARNEGLGWLEEAMLPALLGETTRREKPDVVAKVSQLMSQANPEGVARALEAMRERPDSTLDLSTIRVPTHVIVGDEDTLTPVNESGRICAEVEGARLSLIPGSGHLSNLEAPETFNEVMLSFLA